MRLNKIPGQCQVTLAINFPYNIMLVLFHVNNFLYLSIHILIFMFFLSGALFTMAKSKNHTNHNKTRQHHKNGIDKPRHKKYADSIGVSCLPQEIVRSSAIFFIFIFSLLNN